METKSDSTKKNYLSIWRKFNEFIMKLDVRPKLWEDKLSLYGAFLIEGGIQSSTLKSYFSAIKSILREHLSYQWNDDRMVLSSLIKACRLTNDLVKVRLPIHIGLLEILLFEIQRLFGLNQPYLESLYKTIFIAYYGMFRIGKLTLSKHTLKAKDVHIGTNKNKIMIILYSSKTHAKHHYPQKIKIASTARVQFTPANRIFCPFAIS